MPERWRVLRLRANRFNILLRIGVNAKVPDVEVNGVGTEDLDERVFAEVERPKRRELHPVAAGQSLCLHFNDVALRSATAKQADAKAVDLSQVPPHVDALDHIRTVGVAA